MLKGQYHTKKQTYKKTFDKTCLSIIRQHFVKTITYITYKSLHNLKKNENFIEREV